MTFLPNSNLALRFISVWLDNKGKVVMEDRAILGWYVTYADAPAPLTFGKLPQRAEIDVVRDDAAGTWTETNGTVHRSWESVIAPLLRAWDLKQAREEAKAQPAPGKF